jgi:hypothetical protein
VSWSKYDGAYGRQGGRIVPFVGNDTEPARCVTCTRILRADESEHCAEHTPAAERLFT